MQLDKLQYRIYTKKWHGLSITDVARENNIPLHKVAKRDLYTALYERWRNIYFEPEGDWLASKRKMSDVFYAKIKELSIANPRAISLGAGLGIIEKDLIERGIDVELQECQDISFNYIRRTINPKTWVTTNLGDLPRDSYDLVLAISLVYVFNDQEYADFFKECKGLLRDSGYLIVWDHDARIPLGLFKRKLKELLLREKYMFWGWLRTPHSHIALAQRHGFKLLQTEFFDRHIEPVPNPPRVLGLQFPWGKSVAQMHVFRASN